MTAMLLLRAVVKKMGAHHIERGLRSLDANHFAIAGKIQAALFYSSGAAQRNVHGANRFFFAATAGSGDSGDAYAEHAAGAVADAVG